MRNDRESLPARAAEAQADLGIVRAALRGDEAARLLLVERLGSLPAALRARHRRLGSPLAHDQFEDVTQNTLLALWAKLESFDGRVPLLAWAAGFGTFEILKALGREQRHRERSGELTDVPDARGRADPETAAAEVLAQLSPQDQDILAQKHVEERTFAEIAASFGWPQASVKTRYYRALETIRRRLPSDEERA